MAKKTSVGGGDTRPKRTGPAIRLKRLIRQLENVELALGNVADDLAELTRRHPELADVTGTPLRRTAQRRRSDALALALAQRGALEVHLEWMPDARARVWIDGHELELPQKLGLLLECLKRAEGQGEDGFIPWKPRADVLAWFQKHDGVALEDHQLDNLVWRLREELGTQAGLHPEFVQVNRERGLRFALRLSAPAWPGGAA